MIRALALHLEAPLLSFGGVIVDNHNVTDPIPGRSLLAGLLGNALGYDHAEADKLSRLQERIVMAVRADRPGSPLLDFHTVDLGQPHLAIEGWTTRGVSEGRAGASSEGTHIRYRHYLADGLYTVVFTVDPADEAPTLDELAQALDHPARPLFVGRKAALPSRPLNGGIVEASSLGAALVAAPQPWRPGKPADPLPDHTACYLPVAAPKQDGLDLVLRDHRDWHNQLHTGRRWVRRLTLAEARDA